MVDAFTAKLLARQDEERRPAALLEKLLSLLMLAAASSIMGVTIYIWCRDERGFSSVPVLAWPAAVTTAVTAFALGSIVMFAVPIRKRGLFSAVVLGVVLLLWRFG